MKTSEHFGLGLVWSWDALAPALFRLESNSTLFVQKVCFIWEGVLWQDSISIDKDKDDAVLVGVLNINYLKLDRNPSPISSVIALSLLDMSVPPSGLLLSCRSFISIVKKI